MVKPVRKQRCAHRRACHPDEFLYRDIFLFRQLIDVGHEFFTVAAICKKAHLYIAETNIGIARIAPCQYVTYQATTAMRY